ncbi:MAG TPA: GDP-mannose 4,6-dehydratase [Pirellulales bacterium]|jgi:GDPmannose 4,6-dehydratase|nr:GDP-mannose 4,6-dehydratase [Pirellulales bacterium]
MPKTALITGITGQDGSYLAELLLAEGCEVHGLVRRSAVDDPQRLARIWHLRDRLQLRSATIENYASVLNLLATQRYDECYHLAAQSSVPNSFADGFSTLETNIDGTHHLLEGLRLFQRECRFYFAASSEIFGRVREIPQRETTPFYPRSPYGISKVAGFELTRNYRESYGMYCASGILFNHESPRRGMEFVTRKITVGVARIKAGFDNELRLGNLEAQRDWGHAADYVRAMPMMLRQAVPDDYVIATGTRHSVREFCELAFAQVGLDYRDYVRVDERFFRPAEVDLLVGDASKAREKLGWAPHYSFSQLVEEMVRHDLEQVVADAPGPASFPT